ncbi:MAG TPA: HEAT repeat domain-containing protein [Candidatus Binatia bacterium]|jgi:HEAT repeat protein
MNETEIAELINKLGHDDKPTLRVAVDALIPLASEFSVVRETLLCRLLEAERATDKWPIAYILAHLPNPSQPVIRSLLDALDHRDADIRWAVALLLVRIAKLAPQRINELIDLCASGTANQKRMALYCLRDLRLSDPKSLAALLRALVDVDPTVRVAAAIALKSRSDLDRRARNFLLQSYLNDREIKVRNAAAIALADLGETSIEFLTALRQAVLDEDEKVRKTAMKALELIKKRSASAEENSR